MNVKNGATRRLQVLAAGCATACAVAACLLHSPAAAHAATLVVDDDFSEVPTQEVILTGFDYADLTFSATEGSSFSVVGDTTLYGYNSGAGLYTEEMDFAVLCERPSSTGTTELDGSFTLTFTGCGVDADGDAIDVSITVSNVAVTITSSSVASAGGSISLLCQQADLDNSYLSCGLGYKTTSEAGYSANALSMDIDVAVTKTGTSTAATGTLIFFTKDIDVVSSLATESFRLNSGFGDTVWVTEDCMLDISENNSYFVATALDSGTFDSGFVTLASSSFNFTWAGPMCSTAIFGVFNPSTITATSGSGGSISPSGDATVYWKHSQSYTVTADIGYLIDELEVDGEEVDGAQGESSCTYTFSSVVTDHVITASFAPITYSIVFDANGGEGSMSDQSMTYDTASELSPNAYTRAGYVFTGWNTQADGGGTSYEDGQTVKNLASTEGATILLYAQWEAVICVEVPTLVACTVLPTGEVVEPGNYEIVNKSAVAVVTSAAGITAADVSENTVTHLATSDGTEVFNTTDGYLASFTIDAASSCGLSWTVDDLTSELNADLLSAAMDSAADLCYVTFEFEAA